MMLQIIQNLSANITIINNEEYQMKKQNKKFSHVTTQTVHSQLTTIRTKNNAMEKIAQKSTMPNYITATPNYNQEKQNINNKFCCICDIYTHHYTYNCTQIRNIKEGTIQLPSNICKYGLHFRRQHCDMNCGLAISKKSGREFNSLCKFKHCHKDICKTCPTQNIAINSIIIPSINETKTALILLEPNFHGMIEIVRLNL